MAASHRQAVPVALANLRTRFRPRDRLCLQNRASIKRSSSSSVLRRVTSESRKASSGRGWAGAGGIVSQRLPSWACCLGPVDRFVVGRYIIFTFSRRDPYRQPTRLLLLLRPKQVVSHFLGLSAAGGAHNATRRVVSFDRLQFQVHTRERSDEGRKESKPRKSVKILNS